eukprot:CAMPEP_0174364636 /NCGR_PEP_ID=MMETSP0811_2-20130205/73772_1 /TAXON_ID=73025 ORGANISM="Eutreptiella gymnastica-like, Strain CCMP1594" /NCGR_SAMPLE_ID=MMETSP0811_2 /ASSEMBLY_ACC=CAM_ASM_000667 /LENGTH=44 /DNA_ID= /DNA_START= /DNA_END= /DNA_ORIENTATION=
MAWYTTVEQEMSHSLGWALSPRWNAAPSTNCPPIPGEWQHAAIV